MQHYFGFDVKYPKQSCQAVVLFGEYECDSVDCEFDHVVMKVLACIRHPLEAAGCLSSVISISWRETC